MKKKEIQNNMLACFLLGMLAQGGLFLTMQDWLGKEKYIEHLKNHWLDTHWLIWISISIFAVYRLNALTKRFDEKG